MVFVLVGCSGSESQENSAIVESNELVCLQMKVLFDANKLALSQVLGNSLSSQERKKLEDEALKALAVMEAGDCEPVSDPSLPKVNQAEKEKWCKVLVWSKLKAWAVLTDSELFDNKTEAEVVKARQEMEWAIEEMAATGC